MRKNSLAIVGAVITASLSTLCCLPAFLFLFFGFSSGVLTYITSLEYLRIPMAILSMIFFIYGIKRYIEKISCKCSKEVLIKAYLVLILFFISIFGLLFYPEIIPMFME